MLAVRKYAPRILCKNPEKEETMDINWTTALISMLGGMSIADLYNGVRGNKMMSHEVLTILSSTRLVLLLILYIINL